MKEFVVDSEKNKTENDKPLIQYQYCGGTYSFLMVVSIIVWLFSNVLQSVVTMMLLNGEVIPWVAVLFIIITGIISLGCIPIFIINLIKHIHNLSTGFEIYKDRICGRGLLHSEEKDQRKAAFEVCVEDVKKAEIVRSQFIVTTKKKEEYSVVVNTRDFRRNLARVLNNYDLVQGGSYE